MSALDDSDVAARVLGGSWDLETGLLSPLIVSLTSLM